MNQQQIGVFLKSLREEKGMTQEKLAEMVGVSNRTVSRWENGKNIPDLSILVQMSDYFDVQLSEIVAGKRESGNDDMEDKTKKAILQLAKMYRDEKYDFPQKLNWLLVLGAIGAVILCMNIGDEYNRIATAIIAGVSATAFLINTMYIVFGSKMDGPIAGIDEKIMLCTYKDNLSGVGGHLKVDKNGISFCPHNLNTRKVSLEFSFEEIEDLYIGTYLILHNLLIIKSDGKEYRFLLEKRDREEVLSIYQKYVRC